MIISEKLENLHRKQILKIDVDIVVTILFSYYLSKTIKRNFLEIFITVLIISTIIHRILGYLIKNKSIE